VRFVARTTERAREFPAGGRSVVLDDSVFALYQFAAWRATVQPSELTAIVPRGLRRDAVQVQDLGLAPTTVNRAAVTCDTSRSPEVPIRLWHLWLDGSARLIKVEIPSRRLSAEGGARRLTPVRPAD